MILGLLDRSLQGRALELALLAARARLPQKPPESATKVWTCGHLAMCSVPLGIPTLDEGPQPFTNKDQTIAVMFVGKIYNAAEIRGWFGSDYQWQTDCSGEVLGGLYERKGERFLEGVNGKFSFALWDANAQKLLLARDHFGIESLFYAGDEKRLVFSSSLRALMETRLVDKELNHAAMLQYLLYCYNPIDETFIRRVHKVPASHFLVVDGSSVTAQRYWNLSFAQVDHKEEETYCKEIIGLITDSIRIRLDTQGAPGVLLSGGTDSSTIVSLASGMCEKPLHTFSFRCEGRSYDESWYARRVAQRYGTEHTEIPYHPDNLTLMSKAVAGMDEPFCDIGIEIGTYLLGQAAEGKVSYLLSGEGGDELFGGHPVYTADKVARFIDWVPRIILNPLTALLQRIPDSEQKKNLQVKLKRFAYSMSFPPELLSHRWRTYYTAEELKGLCTPEFLETCKTDEMFEGMCRYAKQADGPDQLSCSLHCDYYTLVNFYLRRLELFRAFSIESRLPLLDYRLVEYAARIPSKLKIKGLSNTKYIYRKALEAILPREILYDRPKLGHSVPMKNWLREDKNLSEWVRDLLSSDAIKGRGLFNVPAVQQLLRAHGGKQENHSHRLWALVVLELWMRRWGDADMTA